MYVRGAADMSSSASPTPASTAKIASLLSAAGGSCSRGCTTAEKLHWWGKGIDDSDCAALAAALAGSKEPAKLKNLLLGSNSIGDACVAALAATAGKGALGELRSIGLSRNRITDLGCESFATAWASHMDKLRALYISKNQVGDRCALALATALGQRPNLTSLSIVDNALTGAGLKGLLEALRPGHALREIAVSNNSICSPPDSLGAALESAAAAGLQRLVVKVAGRACAKHDDRDGAMRSWQALQQRVPQVRLVYR